MTNSNHDALAKAVQMSQDGVDVGEGYCLRTVRGYYNALPLYPYATSAWINAKYKHKESEPPAGVPLFWTGGSHGYGHVAISAYEDGYCWTTDYVRIGKIDKVKITDITQNWNLVFRGWTSDINGQIVVPIPDQEPAKPVPHHENIANAQKALQAAINYAKDYDPERAESLIKFRNDLVAKFGG